MVKLLIATYNLKQLITTLTVTPEMRDGYTGIQKSHTDVAVDAMDIAYGQWEPAVNVCDSESGDVCGCNVTATTGDFAWTKDTTVECS